MLFCFFNQRRNFWGLVIDNLPNGYSNRLCSAVSLVYDFGQRESPGDDSLLSLLQWRSFTIPIIVVVCFSLRGYTEGYFLFLPHLQDFIARRYRYFRLVVYPQLVLMKHKSFPRLAVHYPIFHHSTGKALWQHIIAWNPLGSSSF